MLSKTLLNIFYSIFLSAFGVLLTLLFQLKVSEQTDDQTFGQFSLLYTTITILSMLCLFGNHVYVNKIIPTINQNLKRLAKRHTIIVVLITTALIGIIFFITFNFFAPTGYSYISSVSLLFLATLLFKNLNQISSIIIQSEGDTIRSKMYGLVLPTLISLIAIFLFKNLQPTLNTVFTYLLMGYLIATIPALIFTKALDIKRVGVLYFTIEDFKKMFMILISTQVFLLLRRVNVFIVNISLGDVLTGYYTVCITLSGLGFFITNSINNVTSPIISNHLYEENKSLLRKTIFTGTAVSFIGTLFLGIILFVYGQRILFLYGEGFQRAFWPMIILFLGQGITSLLGPSDIILFLLGKEKTVTILASFFLTLNIIFSFIASKQFGFEGVAITQALTNVFLYLILTLYLKSNFSINSTVFQRY